MKHLVRFFVLAAVVFPIFMFTAVRPAHANCVIFSGGFGQTVTVTFITGHTYTDEGIFPGGTPFSFTNAYTGPTIPPHPFVIQVISETLVDNSTNCGGTNTSTHFDDGRLNFADAWETAAIYCMGDGSVRVYVIGSPNWTIDFTASPAEISKVQKHPDHNTLIEAGHFAQLYRLMSGQLQVNAPGLNPVDGIYWFVFQDCPVNK